MASLPISWSSSRRSSTTPNSSEVVEGLLELDHEMGREAISGVRYFASDGREGGFSGAQVNEEAFYGQFFGKL
ncbi:hypothetical protein SASPL_141742 [Salvia splendens]|uniref:Uncharacterized protein n=1 Tax=Salvia splendens TaxID=180675 RepID=A0A8X8WKC6_SALSN|nr:hypothetical protein SASPL_141742 [Salvia splendens]